MYSRFIEGRSPVVSTIDAARDLAIPVIVLGELRAGFKFGTRAAENERKLGEFLANSAVRILDVDEAAADHYSVLMADLRRRGRPVPTNDVWIAALALRENLTILTADHHFQEMRAVKVRHLPEA